MTSTGKIAFAVAAALVASTTWAKNYTLTLKPVTAKYGKVSGGGKYAQGKKLTIKAKAKSGYVFAGWYTDKTCTNKLDPKGYDNRKPTVKIKMPSTDTTIYAKFVSKTDDKKMLGLASATKKLAKTAANATIRTKFKLKLEVDSCSLVTFTAEGLPKGLAIDKKSGVISGKPKKAGVFKATVTAKTAAGNTIKFKVKIVVRDRVQLWKNGPYWATTNIGAVKPEERGLYFWWGDTKGHSPSSKGEFCFDFDFDDDNPAIYTCGKSVSELQGAGWLTSDGVLAPKHDAAHVHWGGNWRMPTHQELFDLGIKCEWFWITRNGSRGYVVRGKGKYASASIFLPSTGDVIRTRRTSSDSVASYWSSVPHPDYDYSAWAIYFNSGYYYPKFDYYRYCGFSIRPVQSAK